MTSQNQDSGSARRRSQLLKGLLELAVLSAMRDQPQYGLSLLDQLRTKAGLQVAEGSIYPLLYRLEHAGLIKAIWRLNDQCNRPRRYYELTGLGRRDLIAAQDYWLKISYAFNEFLNRDVDREQE